MAVTEAMSFGLCPIVSDVCALPEFVIGGKTGLLVTPGDTESLKQAMEKVISDPKLRKKYGQESRRRFITHFSQPVFSERLRQLFVESL
jgi:glycosyltransferase involved in cell wall biosynthesis